VTALPLQQSAEAFGSKKPAYVKPAPGSFPLDDYKAIWAEQGVAGGHMYGVPGEYRHMRVPTKGALITAFPNQHRKGHSHRMMAWARKMLGREVDRAPLHGPKHDMLTAGESEDADATGQSEPERHRIRDAGIGSDSTPLGQLLRKYVGGRARSQTRQQHGVSTARSHRQHAAKHAGARAAAQPKIVWAKAVPLYAPAVAESPIVVTVDRPPVLGAAAVPAPAMAPLAPAPAKAAVSAAGTSSGGAQPTIHNGVKATSKAATSKAAGGPNAGAVALARQLSQQFIEDEKVSRSAEDAKTRPANAAAAAARAWAKLPEAVRIYEKDAAEARDGVADVLSGKAAPAVRRGSAVASGEKAEVAKLKAEVLKLKEQARVSQLKRQISRLRKKLQPPGQKQLRLQPVSQTSAPDMPLWGEDGDESSAESSAESEEGGEGAEGAGDEENTVVRELEGEPAAAAAKKREMVRVCDSVLGCRLEPLHRDRGEARKSTQEYVRSALDDEGEMARTMFPGGLAAVWEPEVHMSRKGEIRADHGDPRGVLFPRNKYQDAEYPDGTHERAAQGTDVPGLTDALGRHLFRDNIVKAVPGFNAGLGRHVRAQQFSDWQRNWETHRPTKADSSVLVG